ncbi:cAMP-binding domain of CRP or a regulatory subunit of cAMP-dependent protein kinases [Ornithinimicrobium cerasi]|uniref:CRP-like cAMP-activated global transcriptional regulator n=1 Tax=Ornithinimicrobium cerasi TaxID=2248773 RepID=A0A285VQV7_9MICO|nr:cAMP-binding domain of CRP or a regulatory subunit of cAMP-dependent protein kinases [Ornithinimicrobium cerasi]
MPATCNDVAVDQHVVMKAPLFSALDEPTAERLIGTMTPRRLSRGEVVFREGDPGDSLYVTVSGKIKLARTSADGRENLLSVLGPGEMFGELSLFDPGPRLSTAYVVSNSELISLGNDALRTFLADHPEVAMQMLAGLAHRLRRTNEGISDLVFTDVPGRVAKALLDLSDRFGRRTDVGLLVAHDLTQEELAQLVGASRETVNKALADFAHRGWIMLGAKAVTLLDVPRLRRRAR